MATLLKKPPAAAPAAPPQAFVPFAELDKICSVIQGLNASLKPNWDGYGAVLPAQADIDNAIDFIRRVPFAVETPKPMIDGGGDVGFEWRKDDIYVEVGFIEGTISFVVRISERGERIYGDEEYKGSIPASLLQGLARTIES